MTDVAMRWIGVRLDLAACCITIATALALIVTKGSTDAAQAALALTLCIKVFNSLCLNSMDKLYVFISLNAAISFQLSLPYLFLCFEIKFLLKTCVC